MYFFRKHTVLATCLLCALAMQAQRFRITELPNQEKLPVANVHRIMLDREGYMWYATEGGGLCRDDGYRIEIFRSDKNNPSLLASNNITCMTEDWDGCIWFGTTKGAYILDKKDYSIQRIEDDGIKGNYIPGILATKDSAVWISASGRIFRYRPQRAGAPGSARLRHGDSGFQIESYPSEWKGQPCNIVNFYERADGIPVALQGGGGLLVFDPSANRFKAMRWTSEYAPNYITAGTAADELWVGTWGQGVVRYHPSATGETPLLVPQPATVGQDGLGSFRSQVLNIHYDKRHNLLWTVSMDDLYAYRIEQGMLRPYDTEKFLPKGKKILDNAITDRNGNLWVPGYSPHTFIVHTAESVLRRDSVKAMSDATGYRVMVDRIVREDDRYYWIWQGRTNLSLYDSREQVMVFTDRNAHPAPFSTAKCLEKRHGAPGIWTCSEKQLFYVWHQGGDIFRSTVEPVKVKENIRTLCDDRKGHLYIGTDDAVYRYDYNGNGFRPLSTSTGAVLAITVSTDGTVFFASDKRGVCRLERQKDQSFKLQPIPSGSTSPGGFCTLAAAPDGTLWAGTSRGNVCHYSAQDGRLLEDEKAGNKNGDAIKGIVTDATGHVWILTDKYLKEYNPDHGVSRSLSSSDPKINMDYFHTVCREGDSICLGGIGAFCMIAPSENLSEKEVGPTPTLWFTDGVRHIPGTGERDLYLGHGTEDVEIFVTTFDYLHADSIQFAYRLNCRGEWTVLPKGTNRIVPDRIPVGTSELEVKATDKSGIWQEPVVCLTLHRELHWAVTAAIYTLFIIVTAGGVMLYIRRRRKKGKKAIPVFRPRPAVEKRPEDTPAMSPSAKADEEFLRRAVETIHKNIDNADYSVEQFSNDMFMSRMNMYRKLQMLTSQKPSEFIRDIRLERAVELMQTTDLSVSEIVDRVGFGTPRYFSKCFKEKYGVSPSQYHRSIRQRKESSAADGNGTDVT